MQQRLTAATLIVALAGAVYAARITTVEVVDISGDYTLTATKGTDGVVTLTTGVVKGFHLTEEASAGGYRLTNVAPGNTEGDTMPMSQLLPQANDVTGTLGEPTVHVSERPTWITVEPGGFDWAAAGCFEYPVLNYGAKTGNIVQVSATHQSGDPEVPIWMGGYVPSDGTVVMRVCSSTVATLAARPYRVTVLP